MAQDKDAFLSRWSRRKLDAEKEGTKGPSDDAKPRKVDRPGEARPGEQARATERPTGAAVPATELPSLDKLTAESDFREFMKPGVDPILRRAALKKLFADPRFNVIDSMDIDIEDLSNLEKLSPEVAKTLAHAKRTLFGWDEEKKEQPEQTPQVADASGAPGAPSERQEGSAPQTEGNARPDPDPSNKKA